jgi:hypothetical protein
VRKKQIAKLVGRDIQATYKENSMMEKFEVFMKLFRAIFVTVLWLLVAVAWWNEAYLSGILAGIMLAVVELEDINEKLST